MFPRIFKYDFQGPGKHYDLISLCMTYTESDS